MSNRLRKSDKMTMGTIATDLSVSKTTISRAISGKGRVSKATREKIISYISKKGYSPNSLARSLAESKSRNIGIVVPGGEERGSAPFFRECLIGITEAAVKRDYDTVLVVVSDDNISSLERLVLNHKVDGIVITRSDTNGQEIAYLQKMFVPFILIGQSDREDVFQIDSNQKDGCRDIISNILSKNDFDIAFLGSDKRQVVEQLRFEGYKEAHANMNRNVKEEFVFWDSEQNLEGIIQKIVNLECSVGCIACSDDVICVKVMKLLKKMNVSVPEQMQVVSFFDNESLEHSEILVTALYVDTKQLSIQAGNLLLDLLEGKNPTLHNYMECSIFYRNSSL